MRLHRGWGKSAAHKGPHPDRKRDLTSPAKAWEVNAGKWQALMRPLPHSFANSLVTWPILRPGLMSRLP